MRLAPRSLRTRITVVFTVGTAAALGLCLALLYLALHRQIAVTLDGDLTVRAQDLSAGVRGADVRVITQDPLAQLYDHQGALLAGSPSLEGRRLLSPREVQVRSGRGYRERTLPASGHVRAMPVRVLAQPLDDGRVLAVAASTTPLREAQRLLLLVLSIAAPLLVAVVATAGWLVVRAALRPVGLLTREADSISTLEEDRSLPAVPGDDEIARLARTLDQMLERLRVAFERERAFVDDASHELRTPLAVLRGEIELGLLASGEPAEMQRSLEAAHGEVERLGRLAEDLLTLARARAGSLVIRREPVDLLALSTAVAERLAPLHAAELRVQGEGVVVAADPDRLGQLLTNLVQNSLAAGAATVEVTVTAGPQATLQVADDGPGFAPGVRDRAFERFVRGDGARTHSGSGAGLGLSIVRAITAAHGGTISARNGDPLGGAVVTVHLPVA